MFSTLKSRSGEKTLQQVRHSSRPPLPAGEHQRLACSACRQKKVWRCALFILLVPTDDSWLLRRCDVRESSRRARDAMDRASDANTCAVDIVRAVKLKSWDPVIPPLHRLLPLDRIVPGERAVRA